MADKYFEKAEERPNANIMKAMGKTRSGKRHNTKLNTNTTNYTKLMNKNKTVKVIKKENIHISKTNVSRAQAFLESLQDIPMYLIYAHACICPEKGDCYDERKVKQFRIPKDTYLINFVQPEIGRAHV